MQHSHSRHQKTTSNFLRIHFKSKLGFGNGSPLEGAMYINLWFGGSSRKCHLFAIFSKYWWFQTKRFTRLLEFIKLYKQNSLEISLFFIFTTYQNYTSALMVIHVVTYGTICCQFEWWNKGFMQNYQQIPNPQIGHSLIIW